MKLCDHSTSSHSAQRAFTRVELLAVLAALALLAAIALPGLAHTQPQTRRVLCANNLRQISIAMQHWANDHGDAASWCTYLEDGGTRVRPGATDLPSWANIRNNAWFQYSWISNELVTARVLACPSDAARRVAQDFSGNPAGGFSHANYRGNALSYLIGLHSGLKNLPSGATQVAPMMELPQVILAADRNIRPTQPTPSACSMGVSAAAVVDISTTRLPVTTWRTDQLHGDVGNVLLNDGSVEMVTANGLSRILQFRLDDAGVEHFLIP